MTDTDEREPLSAGDMHAVRLFAVWALRRAMTDADVFGLETGLDAAEVLLRYRHTAPLANIAADATILLRNLTRGAA